jgi:hypothetical protein
MIKITANIEDKSYHYKDWYKEMDSLVGENFNSNSAFENSLSVGLKIHFEIENPTLPNGLTIPQNSKITLDILCGKILVVTRVAINGNNREVDLGIRSTDSSD